MKETYLPFTADMVNALLDGRKLVTRRPLVIPEGWELHDRKPSKITSSHPKKGKWGALIRRGVGTDFPQSDLVTAPCFVGDLVWVRETWGVVNHSFDEDGNMVEWTPDRPALPVKELKYGKGYYTGSVIYRADGEMRWCNDFEEEISAWHPSIHMPKAASRITLKVADVRIERVQEITEEQAVLEGMPTDEECQRKAIESGLSWYQKPVTWFKNLWDGLYNNWSDNPYVWVIEFEVVNKNVSEVAEELKQQESAA
ncbi:hypothetical protein [Vibrio parahaemolyticus]|uniref:hypothetical protein n=1 Tax=Vibrio parahaemolyticus TaxID=670 RepID=UPI0024AEC969|nr:hypothetical protein [Vibrio parahaemolyticus]MDI7855118.1 hypothetical protein [Vibrio parahaemolyticus]